MTSPILDRMVAESATVARLADEFAGVVNPETITRFYRSSHAALAERASVATFVPLLAERFTRQRLQALARVEQRTEDTTPVVLFLCVQNAGRSQMALGFLAHHAGDAAIGWSGGSSPAGEIEDLAARAMAERGIDITGEFPKPWTDEIVQAADVVVTMGCGKACPLFPGTRYEEWMIPDPDGATLEQVRDIRDEIEDRVLRLIAELGLAR